MPQTDSSMFKANNMLNCIDQSEEHVSTISRKSRQLATQYRKKHYRSCSIYERLYITDLKGRI
jgi:hypothetical protein